MKDNNEGEGPKGIGYKKLAALVVVILLVFSIIFGLLWVLYMSQYSTTIHPKNFEVDMELTSFYSDLENYTYRITNFDGNPQIKDLTLKIKRDGVNIHTVDFSNSRVIVDEEKYAGRSICYSKDMTVFIIAPIYKDTPPCDRHLLNSEEIKIKRFILREGDTLVFEFELGGRTLRGRYEVGALPGSLHASVAYKGALENFNVTLWVEYVSASVPVSDLHIIVMTGPYESDGDIYNKSYEADFGTLDITAGGSTRLYRVPVNANATKYITVADNDGNGELNEADEIWIENGTAWPDHTIIEAKVGVHPVGLWRV